jgi:hypothetical protein
MTLPHPPYDLKFRLRYLDNEFRDFSHNDAVSPAMVKQPPAPQTIVVSGLGEAPVDPVPRGLMRLSSIAKARRYYEV